MYILETDHLSLLVPDGTGDECEGVLYVMRNGEHLNNLQSRGYDQADHVYDMSIMEDHEAVSDAIHFKHGAVRWQYPQR